MPARCGGAAGAGEAPWLPRRCPWPAAAEPRVAADLRAVACHERSPSPPSRCLAATISPQQQKLIPTPHRQSLSPSHHYAPGAGGSVSLGLPGLPNGGGSRGAVVTPVNSYRAERRSASPRWAARQPPAPWEASPRGAAFSAVDAAAAATAVAAPPLPGQCRGTGAQGGGGVAGGSGGARASSGIRVPTRSPTPPARGQPPDAAAAPPPTAAPGQGVWTPLTPTRQPPASPTPMPAPLAPRAALPAPPPLPVGCDAAAAVAAALSMAEVSVQQELQPGAWLLIGDCRCQVSQPLGMGSFGAVWAAERRDGEDLAVKEIVCTSHAELLNALYESHLLRVLGGDAGGRGGSVALRRGSAAAGAEVSGADADADACGGRDLSAFAEPSSMCCAGRLPSLVACDTTRLAPELWRVRLVMSRLRGTPLDLFLEQHCLRSVEAPMALPCLLARALLLQLGPVFEDISKLAYHRDVNAHNILIDLAPTPEEGSPRAGGNAAVADGEAISPNYGLVDFGLAVDTVSWQGEEGSSPSASRPSRIGASGVSTWHYLDVGGDCRYWPLSAWVQFLAGWRELGASPPLYFEYLNRLDIHALGITGLQVFAELLPSPAAVGAGAATAAAMTPPTPGADNGAGGGGSASASARRGDLAVPEEIWALRSVWQRYWERVSPLHCRLIDTFHSGGDWDALKLDCIEHRATDAIAEDLCALRAALRDAAEACRRSSETLDAAGLFAALGVLIGDGQTREMAEGPRAWRAVGALLRYGGAAAAGDGGGGGDAGGDAGAGAPRSPSCAAQNRGRQQGASSCITAASTASGSGGGAAAAEMPSPAESPESLAPRGVAPPTMQHSASLPLLLLPRPRRVCHDGGSGGRAGGGSVTRDDGSVSPCGGGGAGAAAGATADHEAQSAPRENLVRRLSHLKEKVDWLAHEMARLGDRREEAAQRRVAPAVSPHGHRTVHPRDAVTSTG